MSFTSKTRVSLIARMSRGQLVLYLIGFFRCASSFSLDLFQFSTPYNQTKSTYKIKSTVSLMPMYINLNNFFFCLFFQVIFGKSSKACFALVNAVPTTISKLTSCFFPGFKILGSFYSSKIVTSSSENETNVSQRISM